MTNTEKTYERTEIADSIVSSLSRDRQSLTDRYTATSPDIGYFVVDNLLDEALTHMIYQAFPDKADAGLRMTLRRIRRQGVTQTTHIYRK